MSGRRALSKCKKENKFFIYIASPYSIGDIAINVKRSMDAAHHILKIGHYPHCPLLTHFLHMHSPKPRSLWLEFGLALVKKSDLLLRLEGQSEGADIEVECAGDNGIPVAYNYDELDQLLFQLGTKEG